MIKSIIRYIALGALVATASCTDDFGLRNQTPAGEGQSTLMFRCADMLEVYKGPDNYATRAGGPKKDKEKQIKTLHIFFFDYDTGKLLTPDPENFYAYKKINFDKPENLALIDIPTGNGVSLFKEDYRSVRVVAIANIDATDEAVDSYDEANTFKTADTPNGRIQQSGRAVGGIPREITCYDDLKQWVYYPRIRMSEDGSNGDISELPDAGMPMIGESEGPINLYGKAYSEDPQSLVINMRALMAKVNVSVELDPDQFTSDLPTLTINEYGVLNMPIAVPFTEPQGGLQEGKEWTKTDPDDLDVKGGYFETYDVTKQPMFHKGTTPSDWEHNSCEQEAHEFTTKIEPITINKDAAPITFSYYTFENVNMPNYSAKRASNIEDPDKQLNAFKDELYNPQVDHKEGYIPNYPKGVGEADYQRWKPTIAYQHRASALILKGSYTTHQGLTYQAQFTVYLGRDTDIDFQVKRNYQYDNNIIIKGLDYVRNTTDEVYTFDGRVNLKYDNPLYLAVVEERHVDAHATALPVDVWLMNYEDFTPEPEDYYTDVTFTIPNDSSNPGGNPRDWIQMVMIPREEMQSADGRFYAGSGAEKYFYTRLLEDIKTRPDVVLGGGENGAYEGHVAGAQCGSEVTVSCTPNLNNSRSRVYFYIDENVGEVGNGADRSVDIEVTYHAYNKDSDGTISNEVKVTRTLTIEQRGLLKVPSTHPEGGNVPETYIEYYEEYLDHNDPLEEHLSGDVYENGLEWGLNNVRIFRRRLNPGNGTFNNPEDDYSHQVYTKTGAFAMMRWVFNRTDVVSVTTVNLFNDKENKPASAFHYCLGKNKRDYDGSFALGTSGTKGWYLPGIRELETALVAYYTTFDDFQGKMYWSCACGEDGANAVGIYNSEDRTHSRATSVSISTNNNGTQSIDYLKSGNGQDGFQLRTTPLRIRAFYSKN